MTGGDKGDAIFSRTMEGLFGSLARQVEVNARRNGLLDIALSAARAPANPPDLLRPSGLNVPGPAVPFAITFEPGDDPCSPGETS